MKPAKENGSSSVAVVGGSPQDFLPPLRFGEGGRGGEVWARRARRPLPPNPPPRSGEGGTNLPKRLLCLCLLPFAFCLTSSAAGQEDPAKPETPIHSLVLRPVGPPVPSFRYEFLPGLRDQTRNNAALLHHRALHLLNDYRPPGREFFEKQEKYQEVLKQPIKELPRDEVRAFLKTYTNVFREMEAAAKCDRCEWGTEDRVAAEGIGFLIPDAQKMRELAFLLTLRCRLHAADGKIDLALKDVQTGFALARHAAQGPTLIHFLIGTAIAAQVVTELEQVMQTPEC